MMQRSIYLILFIIFAGYTQAQELNVQVSVNTPKLNKADPKLFQALESDLQDFLNNQSFTEEVYEDHERIKCNVQLTIQNEIGDETFTADLQIQATRPIFGSEQETIILSYLDGDVKFDYASGTAIQFASDGFVNNLSSIFSYWALIVIGLDYDTFIPKGGEQYFKKAESIAAAVPTNVSENVGGWLPADSDRNRFWLVENLLNPKVEDYRLAMYRYYRQGLDVMHKNTAAGQQSMSEALGIVKDTRDAYPNNMIVQLFAVSKSEEIVDVMAKANRTMQKSTYAVMSSIDPANRASYIKLR